MLTLFIVPVVSIFFSNSLASEYANVQELVPEEIFQMNMIQFHILCYKGQPKKLLNIWQSVTIELHHDRDDFVVYEGSDPGDVKREYLRKHSFWSFSILSTNHRTIKVHPFSTSCIGVENSEKYYAKVSVIAIDVWKVLLLLIGVTSFLIADKMSRNTIFQYICGVTIGISASFLIMIYFVSKIVPRNSFTYGIMGCGWTVAIYVLQLLWENSQNILTSYKLFIVWYTVGMGLVSFIVCYIWGPLENLRILNLLRWLLQLGGLCCIFNSSYYREAAVGQIVLIVIGHNLPSSWIFAPCVYWRRTFPPKIELLTDEEYYQQGLIETRKALNQLRKYCSSPECNQWKTIQKLQNVKRFAAFVEGGSHLSDDELLEYETSVREESTDDNSDVFSEEDS